MYMALIIGAVLLPGLLMIGAVLLWRAILDRDRRRSPLNFKILNLPGDGLRKAMERHDEKINEAVAIVVAAGPLMLAGWALAQLQRIGALVWTPGAWLFLLVLVCITGWSVYRVVTHGRKRRLYKQGMEAEIAVAQNLIALMAEGCVVLHDFPADGFNIDHVVVAPNAVFAVETKSRKKPGDKGRDSARVGYDGKVLRFPGHVESEPLEQARRQARWLANFLASGAGDSVPVIPVLALPGWYVERTKEAMRADVIVDNCRYPGFLLKLRPRAGLDASLQRRVVHVLTERYAAAN